MNDKTLIENNIPYITQEGVRYFSLTKIKEIFKDIFIDAKHTKEHNSEKYISSKHLRPMTEFDKTINKIFKK